MVNLLSLKNSERGNTRVIKVIVGLIIILLLGYGGYTIYTDREAMNGISTEIVGVSLPNMSENKVTLPIQIELQNKSAYDSPYFHTEYDIYIGEEKIGEGTVTKTSVKAGETKKVNYEIIIDSEDATSAIWNSILTGNFTIVFKGEMKAGLFFGLVPVSQSFETSYHLSK